uniref:Autophagy-related protein n=1 Tax=viral metagenome TaxID=1070528 RepID=A0A6C0JBM8_9ZZZZ
MGFKQKFPFEKRYKESFSIMQEYPYRVPIICEKDPNAQDMPNISRTKYLVPHDITVANFMFIIRKRINLEPEKSMYLFVGNKIMPATGQLMSQIYHKHKDADGFLYFIYSGENTFG